MDALVADDARMVKDGDDGWVDGVFGFGLLRRGNSSRGESRIRDGNQELLPQKRTNGGNQLI
jgi:hypothetical protein